MKPLENFLKTLGDRSQISVVGPMAQAPFRPTGPTIYVDGGTAARPPGEARYPVLTVGDGDSSSAELDIPLPKDKDFSDLAYVLKLIPASVRQVSLVGFLGGRRDHELINLGEVYAFLKTRTEFTRVIFDRGAVIGFTGGMLEMNVQGVFSLVVLEESFVRLTGACKFPLATPTALAPASSHGLSNFGKGTIKCESSKPCFLFVP